MTKRLVSVDVLRAVAALGVLFTHSPLSNNLLPDRWRFWVLIPHTYGGTGLPLFVVLSGFCIHVAVAGRRDAAPTGVNWAKFWRRRFWRLYPTYAVAAVASIALYYAIGSQAHREDDKIIRLIPDAITHAFMVHNLFRDYCTGLGNGAFWSLGLEEQLYALYFVFLLIRWRLGLARAVVLAALISLTWSLGLRAVFDIWTWGPAPSLGEGALSLGRWMQWPFAWWFIWVLGAAAAELAVRPEGPPRWASSMILIVGAAAAGIVFGQPFMEDIVGVRRPVMIAGLSELCFGVASFGLLNWSIRREEAGGFRGRLATALARVGQMSYSLYLVHIPVIFAVVHFAAPAMGPSGVAGRLVACILGALLMATVLFHVVEKRFLFQRGKERTPPTRGG